MRYVMNCDLGELKKGDEVQEEKAIVWLSMYKYPPVDIIKEEPVKSAEPVEEYKVEFIIPNEPVKEEVKLDLDKDGDVDGEDSKIASKVMNKVKSQKKKKGKR